MVILALCVLLFLLVLYWLSLRPSNQRAWVTYQAVMPEAIFKGDTVQIRHIRNFRYDKKEHFVPRYYDKNFKLNALKRVWFVVVPFGRWRGVAHTMLSFEFEGGDFVCISPEIRREKGEEFTPIAGLLRQFEFMYVVADEADVIQLRSNIRKRKVWMYPIRAGKKEARILFENILKEANQLLKQPVFYNTLSKSCSTAIARHVNQVVPGKIPMNWRVFAAGYSDFLAYQLGLIDTKLSFLKAKRHFMISSAARKVKEGEDFSQAIRKGL